MRKKEKSKKDLNNVKTVLTKLFRSSTYYLDYNRWIMNKWLWMNHSRLFISALWTPKFPIPAYSVHELMSSFYVSGNNVQSWEKYCFFIIESLLAVNSWWMIYFMFITPPDILGGFNFLCKLYWCLKSPFWVLLPPRHFLLHFSHVSCLFAPLQPL